MPTPLPASQSTVDVGVPTQCTTPISAVVVAEPPAVAVPAWLFTVTVKLYPTPGARLPTVMLLQLPLAVPAPETASWQVAEPPPSLTVNDTLIELNPTLCPLIVTVGLAIVLAVTGPAFALSPAALTATTVTLTDWPSANPV